MPLRRVLVIGSSTELASPDELAQARRVGTLLADNGLTAVTDGSGIGAMGTLADTVLDRGGRAVGVVLRDMPASLVHPRLTECRIVDDRLAREREWATLADGILALLAGFPSLDAAFRVWEWPGAPATTPLGLLDERQYYSSLLKHASDEAVDRFVRESQRGMLILSSRVEEVLRRLADFRPPETRRAAPPEDEL